VKHTR